MGKCRENSRNKRALLFAVLWLGLMGTFNRAWGFSGTEGAAFLDIPVGGRPAALGNAYAALANDAYAPVFNPAGLGFLNSSQIAGMHLSYLESISYEYASFVHPLSIGNSLGGSIQYFRPGSTAGTDINGNPIGDFSGHYGAYSLAYGRALSRNLALGLTGKYIDAAIADASAHAYGFDAGATYLLGERMTLAAVVSNVGTHLTFVDQSDPLPRVYRIGTAYRPSRYWNLALQGEYSNSGLTTGRMGVEWLPFSRLALRAGYKTDTIRELSPMAGLTTGIGLQISMLELDYAWLPMSDLGNTQYFSLVLKWGDAERARRNLIAYKEQQEKEHPEGDFSPYVEDEYHVPTEGAPVASTIPSSGTTSGASGGSISPAELENNSNAETKN